MGFLDRFFKLLNLLSEHKNRNRSSVYVENGILKQLESFLLFFFAIGLHPHEVYKPSFFSSIRAPCPTLLVPRRFIFC